MDNADEEHTSGLKRMCNSVFFGLCVCPLLFFVSMGLHGWNEQRAVCDKRAIVEADKKLRLAGCDNRLEGKGELIMLNCPLLKTDLKPLGLPGTHFDASVFNAVGVGLRTKAEMYQCVEHKGTQQKKDKAGGGETTTTTYTYTKEWSERPIDSGAFNKRDSQSFRTNCNADNPAWPSDVPMTGDQRAQSVKVGRGDGEEAYILPASFVQKIPLEIPVAVEASKLPAGWTTSSGHVYESSRWAQGNGDIGRVRVSFLSNDWTSPMVTVLGLNSNGVLGAWTASQSWLCSGNELWDLRPGNLSKSELLKAMRDDVFALTMVLRIAGVALAWFAISQMFAPLAVACDSIPFIGEYIGNFLSSATGCVAFMLALACSMLVIGIMWVVLSPLAGTALLVGALGLLMFSFNSRGSTKPRMD